MVFLTKNIYFLHRRATNFAFTKWKNIIISILWITGWNIHISWKLVNRNFQEDIRKFLKILPAKMPTVNFHLQRLKMGFLYDLNISD